MGFNEKVHAYISAQFFFRLTEAFGERGRAAYVHATRYYAEQRGRRMAQRAIRDGQPLTYGNYLRYCEWAPSEDMSAAGKNNQTSVESWAPDYVLKIGSCPWQEQFREMGRLDAGREYCRVLDAAICRGFNPELRYEVPQNLNDADCCIHRVRDAGVSPEERYDRDAGRIRPFEYHCAHSYWAYAKISGAIFGGAGRALARQVLEDFAEEYGRAMADRLLEYQNTDFNVIE